MSSNGQPPSPNSPEPSALPPSDDHVGNHKGRATSGTGSARETHAKSNAVLRRTIVRPGCLPDPLDSAFVSDRLTALTHELANLLDGSLRCLSLARRAINHDEPAGERLTLCAVPARESAPTHSTTDDDAQPPHADIRKVARHLDTVHAAMQQMACILKASMGGFTPGLMAPISAAIGPAGDLAEAIRHAIEVMQPIADEHHIDVNFEIDARLSDIPAGPAYTIITNTIRNAIESIQRRAGAPGSASADLGGLVLVQARLDARSTPEFIEIEIIDDGQGPPAGLDGGTGRLFDYGVSTKPHGTGIGLAVTRDAIEELGGTIYLARRPIDPHTHRAGAVLSVRFPCPGGIGPAR